MFNTGNLVFILERILLFRETRDIKLGRKGAKSGRVEGVVSGGKNS